MRDEDEAERCIEKLNGIVSVDKERSLLPIPCRRTNEADASEPCHIGFIFASSDDIVYRNYTAETSESLIHSLPSHTLLHPVNTWASRRIVIHEDLHHAAMMIIAEEIDAEEAVMAVTDTMTDEAVVVTPGGAMTTDVEDTMIVTEAVIEVVEIEITMIDVVDTLREVEETMTIGIVTPLLDVMIDMLPPKRLLWPLLPLMKIDTLQEVMIEEEMTGEVLFPSLSHPFSFRPLFRHLPLSCHPLHFKKTTLRPLISLLYK